MPIDANRLLAILLAALVLAWPGALYAGLAWRMQGGIICLDPLPRDARYDHAKAGPALRRSLRDSASSVFMF